jgi:hypothetical protein
MAAPPAGLSFHASQLRVVVSLVNGKRDSRDSEEAGIFARPSKNRFSVSRPGIFPYFETFAKLTDSQPKPCLKGHSTLCPYRKDFDFKYRVGMAHQSKGRLIS